MFASSMRYFYFIFVKDFKLLFKIVSFVLFKLNLNMKMLISNIAASYCYKGMSLC
jgi:hypothetical protein